MAAIIDSPVQISLYCHHRISQSVLSISRAPVLVQYSMISHYFNSLFLFTRSNAFSISRNTTDISSFLPFTISINLSSINKLSSVSLPPLEFPPAIHYLLSIYQSFPNLNLHITLIIAIYR